MTLHFILGGGMTEQQWADLVKTIQPFYTARLGVKADITFYRFDEDVAAKIKANFMGEPLTLVGHSFGGWAAVKAAAALAPDKKVDHLVLFDPVDPASWDKANAAGLGLSANVAEAICYYRGATGAPFSTTITSGPNYKNVLYSGDHGKCVWDAATIGMIGKALKGQNMLPAPSSPVPVPTDPGPIPIPTPVPGKTVESVTVKYTDGTSQVFKA